MPEETYPVYTVRIRSYLEGRRLLWLPDEVIVRHAGGETILSGPMDQATLHGILSLIRDLGVELIAVEQTGAADSPAGPADQEKDRKT